MPTSTKITTIAALSRRKARGVSGSGFAGSGDLPGSAASSPATAVTAASGHHAMPRAAYTPIRKKTPSQASVGHGVGRPRRAMTIATSEHRRRRRSDPGIVRIDVACHSAMSLVTAELVVSPAA